MPQVPKPTEAELAILAALWRLGPASVPQIHAELGATGSYTTTLKFMQIMLEKGLLRRERAGRGHVYRPAIPRQRMQKRLAGDLLKRAFAGSVRALLVAALSSQKANADELVAIRKLIEDAERGTAQPKERL